MIRFLLRFIGLLLLALAFIFVVYDGIRSISDGGILVTKTSYVWSALHEGSLKAFQGLVEQKAGVEAWQIGVATVLDQPASLTFCVLGIVLVVLGRKKKPLIGYARD
jgi:hypothetical protein